jgi:SAM-dependent methyltransferase
MTREEKLLLHVRKEGIGVEIGASHSPIASKRDGFNVHVIDHATREELIEKYRDDEAVRLDRIEEVDYVWKGEDYAELTGNREFYDWILASHVIEHTPDLIGFLRSCEAILKTDGVLSLAIPDHRYCFDHFRPISSLSTVIDAHHSNATRHTPGSIAEYFLNFTHKCDYPGWSEVHCLPDVFTFRFGLEEVADRMRQAAESKEYIDCHAWCFTPHSFRLMIHDLNALGLIKLNEVEFFPSEGCEFHVALSKGGAGCGLSRLELLTRIQREHLQDLEPAILLSEGSKRMRIKWRQRIGALRARAGAFARSILGGSGRSDRI